MYAIVEAGGKQHKVMEGAWININRIAQAAEDSFETDRVMLVQDGDQTHIGAPFLAGAKVTFKVMRHFRDKKVVVFKMKRRKGYRKKQGHRQDLTQVMVTKIRV